MPNSRPLSILHLEDLRSDADLVERALRKSGLNYQLKLASNKKEFESALVSQKPDLILSDHSLPDFSSLEALKLVRSKFGRLPFILITSTVSEEFAVSIMKEGIDDYILKDRLQRLPTAIESAILKYTAETEKDRYLSELLNQKKKFKALIEKSHDCIALLDDHLRTIYISASVYHKIGLEYDEFDHFNGFGQIHPEDEKHIEATLAELQNSPGQSLPITFRSKHKLGHYLWLNGTATNLLQSPEVNAIVINFRDITQNRLAEEELIKNSRHFKALIENITDGIILVNQAGAITYTSPSLQTITGLNEDDTAMKAVFDFCHPDYTIPFLEVFNHALNSPRTPQYGALKIRHKNGHYIWVEGTFNNLLDDASVNAIIINFRDITQRKNAEDLLKKSQATLLTVVNNAELAYVLLDKKFRVVSFNERAYSGYIKEFKKTLSTGSYIFDYLPEERRESTKSKYTRILTNGETLHYESSFEQEDGS